MQSNLKQQLEQLIETESQLFSHEATLASGNGWQKVNKTSSAIRTTFEFNDSKILDPKQKKKIAEYLSSNNTYRSKDAQLHVKSQVGRQQSKNKIAGIVKIKKLLHTILYEDAPRKKTDSIQKIKRKIKQKNKGSKKVSLSSAEWKKLKSDNKRTITKKRQSQKKKQRREKDFD